MKRTVEIVVVTSTHCAPCKQAKHIIEEHTKNCPVHLTIREVDAEDELSKKLGTRSVPTIYLIVDGVPAQQVVGASWGIADLLTRAVRLLDPNRDADGHTRAEQDEIMRGSRY